ASDSVSDQSQPKKKSFWGDTEYGIGWLPLGGYCKIAGMIDESMDTEQMKKPAQDWEFRSKPAWQRLLIMIAGVLFNFLLAIIIYAGIVYATGEKYVPMQEAKMGFAYSGEAQKIGFRDGDIPLSVDGEILENPAEARMKIIQGKEVKVLRDGKDTVTVTIPEKFLFALDAEAKSDTAMINFFTYRMPTRITQVAPGEGAAKAGLKVNDEIIAIDSLSTPSLDVFLKTLPGHDNQTVNLTVLRKNEPVTDTLNVPVALSSNSKMGIGLEINPSAFFNTKDIRYNIFQSIPRGVEMGTERLTSYAKSMKMVFTKEGANSIGGFGSIGSIFPEKWDWIAFWNIAAFLSVALAFMNILPIPALDGGHVMFLLYEVIFRRPPSEKFMERAQIVGMTLLILLLIYANGMDIVRLFK
ncbi:MAG: RIP metalloprotease RseP, partial [Muribaculaceae bacterium]|nr:RIP metalloprotease RseP [Muribaculaceae bacterium]